MTCSSCQKDIPVNADHVVLNSCMCVVCTRCLSNQHARRGSRAFVCPSCNEEVNSHRYQLCFDKDRSKKIQNRLRGPDRKRLLEEYPSLDGLAKGDVPPFYIEIGKVGRNMIIGKSCYHFAHPTLFCRDTREEEDQSSSLARLNTPTRLP